MNFTSEKFNVLSEKITLNMVTKQQAEEVVELLRKYHW